MRFVPSEEFYLAFSHMPPPTLPGLKGAPRAELGEWGEWRQEEMSMKRQQGRGPGRDTIDCSWLDRPTIQLSGTYSVLTADPVRRETG